ncbi:unnamed protein product [Coffea canephora]|uniref:Uncharacterized protein n=1 Tax=Coffea canephora TaxID=49390 RepID=A0A068UR58_COFCA|nr:unnamed protein product [Coffea canephora]
MLIFVAEKGIGLRYQFGDLVCWLVATIVPVGLYHILKYFSAPSGLVQLFCLYGYSLFVFIPALCLSVIPSQIVRWVIAGVAGFMSPTFVALNLRNHIKSAGERWFRIVVGIRGGARKKF